jgi:hypothetical protein
MIGGGAQVGSDQALASDVLIGHGIDQVLRHPGNPSVQGE